MHLNEKLLRDSDEAQARGDIDAFFAGYTDDVIVHVPGKNSLAGVYKGKDQLREVFGKFMERSPDFAFDNHAYFADDEHGVILQRSTYARGSERLSSNDTFVCHFREGKISEFWLCSEDQDALDKFIG